MRWLLMFLLLACGRQEISSLKEPMNAANNPELIPGAVSKLEYVFANLPDSGSVSRIWVSSWYPLSEGGTATTRYGSPSALAKYDMATGSHANDWELAEAKKYAGIDWAGRCNGAAAAEIMTEEPTHSVTYNGVTFSPTDVTALLVEAWQGSGSIVGDRCNTQQVTYDQYGRIKEDACRAVNPATFHLAVANYLGLFGKAVIGDIVNTQAIWNYPLRSYSVISKTWLTKNDAIWYVQRGERTSTYVFNPDAVDFVYVKISAQFMDSNQPHQYEYILELDQKGRVLGGEWMGNSRAGHPNFIWRPDAPRAENPYLDIQVVNKIYKLAL